MLLPSPNDWAAGVDRNRPILPSAKQPRQLGDIAGDPARHSEGYGGRINLVNYHNKPDYCLSFVNKYWNVERKTM